MIIMRKPELQKFFSKKFKLKISIVALLLLQFTVSDIIAQVSITTTKGFQSYDVSSLGFANADIVILKSGADSTAAVVVNGKIEFYVPQSAQYSIKKESTVAASTKSSLGPVTVQEYAGGVLPFGQYKGKDDSIGTAVRPLTGLTHFIGIGALQTGNISSSWKQANTYAGYSWYGDALSTRGACYILIEYRNETTGKLLASLYFDPSISEMGPQSVMGPHAYNFIFNPTDAIIASALATHSTYQSSTELQASALDSVKAVRDADNSMVLANIWFLRAYSTKAKTYTFDIATISGGKFKSGDVLELKYLLGSYDLTTYHSGNSTAVSNLEANAQSKVSKDTVDADGYVTLNIYGGGFLSLTKVSSGTTTGIDNTIDKTSVNVYPNPVRDQLTISTGNNKLQSVSVIDLTGKTVMKSETATILNLGSLVKGMYLMRINTANGTVTKLIIKE